jgi:hypothetical protein
VLPCFVFKLDATTHTVNYCCNLNGTKLFFCISALPHKYWLPFLVELPRGCWYVLQADTTATLKEALAREAELHRRLEAVQVILASTIVPAVWT